MIPGEGTPVPNYITIPKGQFQSLIREAERGIEVCAEVADLRVRLRTLEERLPLRGDKVLLGRAIESCKEVTQLRVELVALVRSLKEFDQELTPSRPPSRADIEAAFENSSDFLTGKKKPPGAGG